MKAEQYWERFQELTTTQLLGASNALPIEIFTEWIDEAAEDSRPMKKFLIFFEEGAGEERITAFAEVVRMRLPDQALEVVPDVPHAEIVKMIALANEINGN